MVSLKLISAALFAAAVIAAPAMAREHHARHYVSVAATEAAYAGPVYGYYGYRCGPAPRVGAFATAPWVPCEPAYSPYAHY